MTDTRPSPLYPPLSLLKDVNEKTFPDLWEILTDGPAWRHEVWLNGQQFLAYVGRTKSEHTYLRFRSELEKFLLWSFFVKQSHPRLYKKADILDYIDFCWKPPTPWICLSNRDKFFLQNGAYISNPEWAPFRLLDNAEGSLEKRRYRPSQQSLQASFTGVIAFYRFLMDEEICLGNPAQLAKKDCRYLIKGTQVRQAKRLTEQQWRFLLQVATAMASEDSKYERNLFLIAALKSLFLRISELSERRDWIPSMGHFWSDRDGNWWLKVYGKGRKLRDVTVPTNFMGYLKRYRAFRGLPALPSERENGPILEKIRGRGGLTARQLSRLVREVFEKAYTEMLYSQGKQAAAKFQEASSHWLRHTGASLEIERGRALRDVSEDLGHASMGTTDTIYVSSEHKKRAESGKERLV